MTDTYSEEARTAARELRARLKRDLAEGRFVSSSAASRHPRTTVSEPKGDSGKSVTRAV